MFQPKQEFYEITPKEAIILYYQVNVIYKLIHFTDESIKMIRDDFLEEFRYF